MSIALRFMTVSAAAVMLLVQPVCTGWVVECGCETSNADTCSTSASGCCCCPAEPDNSAKQCAHCQRKTDDSQPPAATRVACHCGEWSPIPPPPQCMPGSSGLDSLNGMAAGATCFVVARPLRITQAHSQMPSSEASIPNFKQVACHVWLI